MFYVSSATKLRFPYWRSRHVPLKPTPCRSQKACEKCKQNDLWFSIYLGIGEIIVCLERRKKDRRKKGWGGKKRKGKQKGGR